MLLAKVEPFQLTAFPKNAAFGRAIPKNKIYQKARPGRALQQAFVNEVQQIIWQYKLAPETINLQAKPAVPEIQIFRIEQKTPALNEDVLRCIDKAIPLPVIYQLSYAGKLQMKAAYKRPSDADSQKWVVHDNYFESPWLPEDSEHKALPVVLDLQALYDDLLRQLMPQPARPGEPLKSQVERLEQIRAKTAECNKYQAQLNKEKQFNRKVELNAQVRQLQAEIKQLQNA